MPTPKALQPGAITIHIHTYTYPCMHLSILIRFYVLSCEWNKGVRDPIWLDSKCNYMKTFVYEQFVRNNFLRNFNEPHCVRWRLVAACCIITKCAHTHSLSVDILPNCVKSRKRIYGTRAECEQGSTKTLQGSLNIISGTCHHYIIHHNPNCFYYLVDCDRSNSPLSRLTWCAVLCRYWWRCHFSRHGNGCLLDFVIIDIYFHSVYCYRLLVFTGHISFSKLPCSWIFKSWFLLVPSRRYMGVKTSNNMVQHGYA